MPNALHLYTIHSTKTCASRHSNMSSSVALIQAICDRNSIAFTHQHVASFEPHELQSKLSEYESMVDYTKLPLENPSENEPRNALNDCIHTLNLFEISNLLKHKEVWQTIACQDHTQTTLNMILEDDAVWVQSNVTAFEKWLSSPTDAHDWDLLFLGLSNEQPHNEATVEKESNYDVLPLTPSMPILASKECYFIKQSAAFALSSCIHGIKFNVRHLLSYFIAIASPRQFPKLRLCTTRRRFTIDGSKLGLYPSTLHENNILIYNKEFMFLLQMMKTKPNTEWDIQEIESIHELAKTFRSPDLMHLIGVLFCNMSPPQYQKGHDLMYQALIEMQQKNGLLMATSDLLNNYMNSCQYNQKDLDEITAQPSKYAIAS
jgi:hypothetical protein